MTEASQMASPRVCLQSDVLGLKTKALAHHGPSPIAAICPLAPSGSQPPIGKVHSPLPLPQGLISSWARFRLEI